jgi:hypothetical protein
MTWPDTVQKGERPDVAASSRSSSNFGSRISRYGAQKDRAQEQAEYIAGLPGRRYRPIVQRLDRCADYLLFRHYFTVDDLRLRAARFCQLHLLCPFCAGRRGAKALGAYLERWEVVRAENAALRPFLVTLTVRDGADLEERVSHLRGAHQRLWKRRADSRGFAGSVMRGVAGGVWSYEVKRGRGSGLWHPHVHGVWLAQVRPDPFALSAEWAELTGDSRIVDVRPIEGDPVEGFCEVFKYALKFSDMTPRDTFFAYERLRGVRLLDAAGAFRGVEVPASMTDELLDGLPYVDRFFRFVHGRGYQERPAY